MAYQLFAALPAPVEDALRASIGRFGVLVPVVRDQHGNTIDGHHRSRIADALGVKYRVDVVPDAMFATALREKNWAFKPGCLGGTARVKKAARAWFAATGR